MWQHHWPGVAAVRITAPHVGAPTKCLVMQAADIGALYMQSQQGNSQRLLPWQAILRAQSLCH